MVRVHWNRITRRAMLVHVYDALRQGGFADRVYPSLSEATSAWEDMRETSSSELASSGGGDLGGILGRHDISCKPGHDVGAAVVQVTEGGIGELLVRGERDVYVNHAWIVCVGLQLPLTQFEKLHLHVATEVYNRFARNATPMMPPAFVRSYQYGGAVAPLLLWPGPCVYRRTDGVCHSSGNRNLHAAGILAPAVRSSHSRGTGVVLAADSAGLQRQPSGGVP